MQFKRVMRKDFAFLTLLAMVVGLLPTVLYAEGEHELTLNGEAVTWDFRDSQSAIYTARMKTVLYRVVNNLSLKINRMVRISLQVMC